MPVEETASVGPPARPAWEDGRTAFPRNLLDTWIESVLRPARFFGGVPYETAAARPLLYFLFITILVALFNLWWTAIFTAMNIPFFGTETEMWGALSPAANALFGFFATPFFAFFGLVFWSGLIQVLVVLFARERRGYRATLRVVCYSSGPQVLSVFPVLGGLVGLAWSLVITGIGLRHAHRMSSGAAVGVVVLAVAIPLILLMAFFVAVFASLATVV